MQEGYEEQGEHISHGGKLSGGPTKIQTSCGGWDFGEGEVREQAPDVYLSVSHQVMPMIMEYGGGRNASIPCLVGEACVDYVAALG